jgi:hypothetical protein
MDNLDSRFFKFIIMNVSEETGLLTQSPTKTQEDKMIVSSFSCIRNIPHSQSVLS